jgi:hypothetical protein
MNLNCKKEVNKISGGIFDRNLYNITNLIQNKQS